MIRRDTPPKLKWPSGDSSCPYLIIVLVTLANPDVEQLYSK